jgi:DNA-directed RNA polymerase subunit delta
MKKNLKIFCKIVTAFVTVGGILYIARDQIKAIIQKLGEVSHDEEPADDDFDEPFDDDEDIFPEPSEDDRDYVSINITSEDEVPAE